MTELCSRKIHRCFRSSRPCCSNCFSQIFCQFLSSTNKQTRCVGAQSVLSDTTLPRWTNLPLFAHKFILSPSLPFISHVCKPILSGVEQGAFSAATILMLLHESSSLRSWGQPGRRQGETRRSPAHCCCGKSTPWLDLWKTDLWAVTLISWWDLLPTGTTVDLWRQLQV